jgi:hypothetical protein
MEFAKTGSVGVTQLPMTNDSRNVSPGIIHQIHSPQTNQAVVMTGPRRMRSDRHSLRRYALGSAIPVKRTWMAMTMRVIWNVRYSGSADQEAGLKMPRARGPKTIPAKVASRASAA